MTTAATLDTNLTLNSTAFRQGMISAANQANTSLKSIQTQAAQTASVLTQLNKAAMAFGGFELLKAGLGSLLQAQVQLQAIQYTLLSATGNTIAAGEAMSFLRAESDKVGLSLPDTAEGFARLAAAASASGVSMGQQEKLFDAFAKASSTLHLSTAQSGRALLALQEMFSRGTISARQLNQQLGQAVPGSAARFKNAVMEMTKGTDLQGKSFEQLQKSGKLITTQFLPALTQALEESGSGWEQAAQGLNANLNRLSTAWFNLKSELSGGLFSDTASKGAALLADNLGRVATAIQLVAAVAVARGLGGLAARGAGAAQFQIQDFRGTQMAAAAERDYAQAQAAEVATARDVIAAEQAKAVATLEVIRNTKAQTIAVRDQIAAEFELVAAQELAARKQAVLATQAAQTAHDAEVVARMNVQRIGGGATLSGNVAYSAEQTAAQTAAQTALNEAQAAYAIATAEATAAQNTLTAARVRYASVSASVKTLDIEQDALNTKLIQSNIALAAAEDAVAVAQARVAETTALQTAVGGLGAAIGRAAKSFGSFALSLVGGPWGIAVLAIGGLIYAFESAKSEAEHLAVQTTENAKAVEELVKANYDLIASYREAGNLESFTKLKDNVDTLSVAVLTNQQALIAAKAALAEMDALHEVATKHVGSLAYAYQIWMDQLNQASGKYAATKASVDQLTTAQDSLATTTNSARAAEVEVYGKDWQEVAGIFQGITGSISSVADAFDKLGGAMNRATAADAGLDALAKQAGDMYTTIETDAAAAVKKLRQKDMNPAQIAADNLKQFVATMAKMGRVPSADQLATGQQAITAQQGILNDAAAKKAASAAESAAKAAARAAADLATAQKGGLAEAKAQLDQTDKIVPAQKALNEELAGGVKAYNDMTAAQKATSRATLAQTAALQQQYIDQQKAIRSAEALANIEEAIANRVAENQTALDDKLAAYEQTSQQAQDARIIAGYQKKFDRERLLIDKDKAMGDVDRAEAIAKNQAALDTELAAFKKFQADRAVAEKNAYAGMANAIAEFVQQQNNQFALMQTFTTDFITQTNDAFTSWETGASSAKKAFGGLIDSMYKEAWQYVNSQVFKSLLLSFNAPGTAGTPGAGGSIWSNLKSSFSGNFAQGPAAAQAAATAANTAALVALTAAISAQAAMSGMSSLSGLGGLFGGGFGGMGSMFDAGNGAGGMFGGLGGLFSAPSGDIFAGLGGLAGGGAANANTFYRVAENGPELLSYGGKSYLMMGSRSGHVTPNDQLPSGGNVTNISVMVQPTSSRRTADQVAEATARKQRIIASRNS